jgi:restriction system protein
MGQDNSKGFKVWMVRAGAGGYLIDEFINKHIAAVRWNEIADLSDLDDYEVLRGAFKAAYPDDLPGRVNNCVGQIWKFVKEMKNGDKIVTYDSTTRVYYIGEIISGYKFSKDYEYFHYREVEWDETSVDRDFVSAEAKNTLGAIMTLFELPYKIWEELNEAQKIFSNEDIESDINEIEEDEEYQQQQLKQEVFSKSKEFIKDLITQLTWQNTERLAAGLLKAMGYKIRMTPKGPDLGSDIIASPDELALEEPRIKVEVKKRDKDKISAPEIRSFLGGLRGHNKGIYFTTTGFSKEAVYEAERANFAITLIDSDWLVELLVSNYELLEPEIKAMVPLKKIYWPA